MDEVEASGRASGAAIGASVHAVRRAWAQLAAARDAAIRSARWSGNPSFDPTDKNYSRSRHVLRFIIMVMHRRRTAPQS